MTKVFLDANVLFSASKSQTGASCHLFKIKERLNLIFYTSTFTFVEAERNIREKENFDKLLNFYQIVKNIKIVTVDNEEGKRLFKKLINEKDAPILYAAFKTKADFLITLDKRHFFTPVVKKAKLPFRILTPSNFINESLLKS